LASTDAKLSRPPDRTPEGVRGISLLSARHGRALVDASSSESATGALDLGPSALFRLRWPQ
jgi:hypothetical protein